MFVMLNDGCGASTFAAASSEGEASGWVNVPPTGRVDVCSASTRAMHLQPDPLCRRVNIPRQSRGLYL